MLAGKLDTLKMFQAEMMKFVVTHPESLHFAGAWSAIDTRRAGAQPVERVQPFHRSHPCGGALTLQDVDPTAGEALLEFRDWAVEQFGSVSG